MLHGYVGHGRAGSDDEYRGKENCGKAHRSIREYFLDENNPERCTKVGADLEEKAKQDLVRSLTKSIDVFTWSHKDMPGIDPSVITHRLNVYPSSKPV